MISFEHANANCTGSQLKVDIRPAEGSDDGVVSFEIVPQATVSRNAGPNRIPAEFSGGSAFADLNAKQATHVLFVIEGKTDHTNGGKGVYDNGNGYVSLLHCDRERGNPSGFAFHIITRFDDTTIPVHEQRILLNPTEAAALAKSLNAAMDRIAFGDR